MATTAVHSTLPGPELHYSKLELISGAPVAAPDYVGQTKYDQSNNILYIATGTSSVSDWKSQSSTSKITDIAAATYSAASTDNGTVFSMKNTNPRTFTLEVAPVNGFYQGIQDGAINASLNNITVSASPNIFQGGSSSYVINSDSASIIFVFDSAVSTWIVISSYTGSEPTFSILRGLTVGDSTDLTKKLQISLSGATTSTKTILQFMQTADITISFPIITDTLLARTTTDILTNKSFNSLVTILAGNSIKFNNAGDTFGTTITSGNNTSNLALILPITAPIAGQVPYSIDNLGTLGWLTLSTMSQQSVAEASIINALPTNTSSVVITGGTIMAMTLNGMVAGIDGQEVTIINESNAQISVIYNSGSAAPGNRFYIPTSPLTIPAGFSLKFVYSTPFWLAVSQLSASNIIGSLIGLPTTGFIGERITSIANSVAVSTTAFVNLTSIALSSVGVWSISANGFFESTGSGSTESTLVISQYPNNTTTDQVAGYNQIPSTETAFSKGAITIVDFRPDTSIGLTIYLKAATDLSVNWSATIIAIRIA